MSFAKLNSLSNASSAYLRSAMHQPVDWQEWGAAAFERAKAEDKPILLDIGAIWCHWCHVMDRESYEDELTARMINDHFIAVKVDRDERPDVDSRYQAAVASISGQGGWPLTAFLTPEGLPYFGGSYFPPQDQHGRPSMQRVLLTMAEAFQTRRDEVNESADSVMEAIEQNELFAGGAADPSEELVAKLIASTLKQFDPRNGGFGAQPKFPHPAAIDLLIDAASRSDDAALRSDDAASRSDDAASRSDDAAKQAAMVTLEKMSNGGIYDQLAGGFHRYSVDERWVVPHFEKMAYDNAGLLKNYVHAYQTFGGQDFARVARETMQWMDEWLSDRERGGFYASQDADVSLDDDGDYFTWTRDEAKAALNAEEFSVAALYFDIGEVGDMHHKPQKNVLHVTAPLATVARMAKTTEAGAASLLVSAKAKMYGARLLRPTPYVDKTVYTAWNGMCISAYLEASRVLGLSKAREFALKSLDRVIHAAWDAAGDAARDGAGMAHVVAYGEGAGPAGRVAGVLDDYVMLGHAALDAWEGTGELRYYSVAEAIAESAIVKFYDASDGGFFDTEFAVGDEVRLGALTTRRKPLQDSPTPAGNSMAAALLLRLEALNGKAEYREKAKKTLEAFSGVVEHFGLYAASYGLALRRLVEPPVQVCVFGEDDAARELEAAALARFRVNKTVIRMRRDQVEQLPPMLAETLPLLPELRDGLNASFAVVCAGRSCFPAVRKAEALIAALMRL